MKACSLCKQRLSLFDVLLLSSLLCTYLFMLQTLKCFTYNVQSLCNVSKWRLLWNYVHKMQPDIVCLQEHNQHAMAGHHGFLHGYDIYYAGTATYSGVCILVRHELEPQLAFNDNSGRWSVVQCYVNGHNFEFASVYASQTSAMRATLWDSICRYPWRSNAFIYGDFNKDRKSTRLNSSHSGESRMPSSA